NVMEGSTKTQTCVSLGCSIGENALPDEVLMILPLAFCAVVKTLIVLLVSGACGAFAATHARVVHHKIHLLITN
ncbi:hypothetical protein ABTI69_22010, partial [Acinetobacter baumannii]